ncbi:MAG: RNA polymerase subunit sigma-24 [Candidatus Rokuibacteriota bacterium]|nr:MAG: RNA polymerase subunit sigma-24 [Candidatus Rokubacteria bacterium]
MAGILGDDQELVAALRRGDEHAFMKLVDEYGPALLRVARMYVPSAAVAEEVVQDTWIAVLNGIDRFEGRSSVKTWIFRILVNIAKTRGARERRSVPFSAAARAAAEEPSVDPDRFLPAGDERARAWAIGPIEWPGPEESLLSGETRGVILAAIAKLAPAQREVITLRDIDGWSSEEVRNALDISETNQRVLLHRARSKVRGAIEQHLNPTESTK